MISEELLFEQSKTARIRDSRRLFESQEFIEKEQYDIFLSYSYDDKEFALIVFSMLEKDGFSVYIDLYDPKLSREKVDEETAKQIASILDKTKLVIYLHSYSSQKSKWCPWELGYMSGKHNFACATLPIANSKGEYNKQEYLMVYPYIDYLGVKDKDYSIFWIMKDSHTYTSLKQFIKSGSKLEKHI